MFSWYAKILRLLNIRARTLFNWNFDIGIVRSQTFVTRELSFPINVEHFLVFVLIMIGQYLAIKHLWVWVCIVKPKWAFTLQWCHNGRNAVSNPQPHDCLLRRLFRRRSKKTSKLRVTSICAGNSRVTGEFPAQMASNAENVSIWWRHYDQIVGGGFTLGFRPGFRWHYTTKWRRFTDRVHDRFCQVGMFKFNQRKKDDLTFPHKLRSGVQRDRLQIHAKNLVTVPYMYPPSGHAMQ